MLAAGYQPSPEVTSEERPFVLTTGRSLYQFHTRTKTGRAPQLNEAAPDVWVEMSAADCEQLGLGEGDLARIESARGEIVAPVRITGIRSGTVFVPFHFGYWDLDRREPGDQEARAANEMTVTGWDPVSKQPLFKVAAVAVSRVSDAAGHGGASDAAERVRLGGARAKVLAR